MSLYPELGFGLGLRTTHYDEILKNDFPIDWFEIISENFINVGGKPYAILKSIRERYPIVMHGVSLSIGGCDPLDLNYLKQLKTLANDIDAAWISDHLCWTGVNGINFHDLLPLPFTQESLTHVVERVKQVQDLLGRRILLENTSSYITYKHSSISESEFLKEVSIQADCLILLDINNVYVNSVNHDFNPIEYIKSIPKNRVQQIHLAGHEDHVDYIIDTHDQPIANKVWQLYKQAINHFGFISTMIERDDNIPPINELILELNLARDVVKDIVDVELELV